MRAWGEREEPAAGRTAGHPAPASRRVVLKSAAVTAGLAATGIATTGPARAADDRPGRPESVTARMGGTSITLSLVDGALRWSARRDARTVIGTSALGLRLGDGTVLGRDVRVIRERYGTHRATWTPVYGRNATVTDHYQEQRWDLEDRASASASASRPAPTRPASRCATSSSTRAPSPSPTSSRRSSSRTAPPSTAPATRTPTSRSRRVPYRSPARPARTTDRSPTFPSPPPSPAGSSPASASPRGWTTPGSCSVRSPASPTPSPPS